MKDLPINTKAWAEWLRFDMKGNLELERLVIAAATLGLAFKEGEHPRWLTMLGPSGVGKTHIGSRLWRSIGDKVDWTSAVYFPKKIHWPSFVSELRGGDAYERFHDIMDWPALFLDDVGAERDPNGFAAEQLNTLMDRRLGRWTIITSNLSLVQIAKIDPRISDRMIRKPNIVVDVRAKSHSL